MLILAIDTSTSDLVVGLVRVDDAHTSASASQPQEYELIDEQVLVNTRQHNELLTPTAVQLLANNDLTLRDVSGFVVGLGPGPFTGLRVGIATAAAFADALSAPIWGVCSLDAAALECQRQYHGRVLIATDARRKEVYWAEYVDGVRQHYPQVGKPEDLSGDHIDVVSIPDHLVARLPESLSEVVRTHARPGALSLVKAVDWAAPAQLQPLYLRRPDAQVPAPVRVSSALVYPKQP
ncbi:tRNA (adenosine(37)-N6)-threonylcarbamoyltransferase complex dimerization subunit type 1 TsaB [Corynebacterium sp. sy039]|uniref:tRNA (adenosine(37)-N6)-threonylcarbamoyltransferase complex dimerization subunit type 1 TsaB n=1 Tax=Corynebacterium sp. sy039 TaxID=2599641 RepID=UPI0011B570EE|nr:tRNA (adenosine(37)-N6)-threonylcarbamoyltransferase complex dimerization subunit type 1 TsaB [Corynebacterium sp. sy039]QDZ42070.1 tRNA (adenosine(37)-N6)-threonylcarbamoyltransferase complex dimerization subunit type 1 TsaB [Corynebacterium sp. sy039]